MHHIFGTSHGKGDKLRAHVGLAKVYLRRAKLKHEDEAKDLRRKVADFIRVKQTSAALVQTEAVLRKEKRAAGYGELMIYCDRVYNCVVLLDSNTGWPEDLEEAMATLVCAYKQWNVSELKDTFTAIEAKCSRCFVKAAARCTPNSPVNHQVEAMFMGQPTAEEKIHCLHEIGVAENVPNCDRWVERAPVPASPSSSSAPAPTASVSRSSSAAVTPLSIPVAQPGALLRGSSEPSPPGVPRRESGGGQHHWAEGGSYFPPISGGGSSFSNRYPPSFVPSLSDQPRPARSSSQQRMEEAWNSPRADGHGYTNGVPSGTDSLKDDFFESLTLESDRRLRSSTRSFDFLGPPSSGGMGLMSDATGPMARGPTSYDMGPGPNIHMRRASQPTTSFQPNPATHHFDTGARAFSFEDVLRMTSNWQRTLGKGGFGMVYYGVLQGQTSRKVAVKRKLHASAEESMDFENEVRTLSMCRHRHLVNLVGYCFEGNEKILIYEFMSNGTLGDHLFPQSAVKADWYRSKVQELSWRMRLNILLGAARGLHYLHFEFSSDAALIHRDVKAANVLLDDKFEAKVADFGLCKYSPNEVMETMIKGTLGYMDPEYYELGSVTAKTDVYSFGVLLLVGIAGREAIDRKVTPEQLNLTVWAKPFLADGNVKAILDSRLAGTRYCSESLSAVGALALKCISNQGDSRPTMKKVVRELEDALECEDDWLQSHNAR